MSSVNLITNGSFTNGLNNWVNLIGDGASGKFGLSSTIENGLCMYALVTKKGRNPWSVQSIGKRWNGVQGTHYVLRLKAKSSIQGMKMTVLSQGTKVVAKSFELSTSWADYEWKFVAPEASAEPKIHYPDVGTYWVDEISLFVDTSVPPPVVEVPNTPNTVLPNHYLSQLRLEKLAPVPSSARVYYVDPIQGHDSNSGLVISIPFKTIAKAIQTMVSGDVCILRGGYYRETVQLTKDNITFRAYQDEKPIITAYDEIPKVWEGVSVSPGLFLARVKAYSTDITPNQPYHVLYNGSPLSPATYPPISPEKFDRLSNEFKLTATGGSGKKSENKGTTDQGGWLSYISPDGKTLGDLVPSSSDKYQGTRIVFSLGAMWGVGRGIVEKIEGDKVYYRGGSHSNWFSYPQAGNAFYLSGRKEFVNYPGAVHVERYDSQIFHVRLRTPDGGNPNNARIEYRTRKVALNMFNKNYITFEGITFQGDIVGLFSTRSRFSHCTFAFLHHPISYRYNSTDDDIGSFTVEGQENRIENCFFDRCEGEALRVVGTKNVILNNVFAFTRQKSINGRDFWEVQSNPGKEMANIVAHNSMINSGVAVAQIVTGIHYYNNDMYNSTLETTDSGILSGVSADCRDVDIAYNTVHDNWGPLDLSKTFYGGHSIYVDMQLTGFRIHHNVAWGSNSHTIDILNVGTTNTKDPSGKHVYNNTCLGSLAVYTDNVYEQSNLLRNNAYKSLSLSLKYPIRNQNNVQISEDNLIKSITDKTPLPLLQEAQLPPEEGFQATGTKMAAAVGAYQPGITWASGAIIRAVDLDRIRFTKIVAGPNNSYQFFFEMGTIGRQFQPDPARFKLMVNNYDLTNVQVKNIPNYTYDLKGQKTNSPREHYWDCVISGNLGTILRGSGSIAIVYAGETINFEFTI